jgi:hypothetical protein
MSPDELRLYTIESKLRAEESNRIQIYDQLQEILDTLKTFSGDKIKINTSRQSSLERKNESRVSSIERKNESRVSSIERKNDHHSRSLERKKEEARARHEKKYLRTLTDYHTPTSLGLEGFGEMENESQYNPASIKYDKPKVNLRYIYHHKTRVKKLPKIEVRANSKLSTNKLAPEQVAYTSIQLKKLEIEDPMT